MREFSSPSPFTMSLYRAHVCTDDLKLIMRSIGRSFFLSAFVPRPLSAHRGTSLQERWKHGFLELNYTGHPIPIFGMDRLRLLVHQFLSSSHPQFPPQELLIDVIMSILASVVGLNFDFVILNLTKHSSYLIYNATLYFSAAVQRQYFEKYGFGQMIPVAANDVAFSIHAVLLTAITLFQIMIYEVS
ncbi:hypothetical protein SAY86_015822 [Trapa natans]|uniref:Uncharacterized protein n=1 Tax=Trapa natans TaxID=22666 RepID=A0AAN7LIM5_TRANT|nr:hypothetical protein SAY86_015822 [Trapa natans]